MTHRTIFAVLLFGVAVLLPATATSQHRYGLTENEYRAVEEARRFLNGLPAPDRGGVELPETDELIRRMLDGQGKECYSTFHRGMMPCEMVRNRPGSFDAPTPGLGGVTSGGNVPIPEPQLGVRSPAYRNLAAQISDQFGHYDDDYEQTRAFLMSFDFEPWIAKAVEWSPCASNDAYPACDRYAEFFDCEFDDWCTAYWANESEDVYLAIVVRAGTGRWVASSPSIMGADMAEWRQISTVEERAEDYDHGGEHFVAE